MTKREHESIKEYAQRWRDLAAQVVPPMTEREMITIMVDTLPTFYYEKPIGYMPANFADLVFVGERIESGLRKGKFEYAANMAPNNNKRAPAVGARKKEGDAHAVTTAPTWMKAPIPPPVIYCDNQSAVAISHNPVLHSRTKHMELDIFFVREKVLNKSLVVSYIPAQLQVADILTKSLSKHLFYNFRSKLRVLSTAELVGGVLERSLKFS